MQAINEFDRGYGEKGSILSERAVYFDNPQNVITLHPFTITLVTITAPIGFLGDRACIVPAGMAAATDGGNYWCGTAGMRPQAAKAIELICWMRAATWADPQWVFGLGVVATTQTAKVLNGTGGDQTDYLLATKTTGTNHPILMARKASGTRESIACAATGTLDATWIRAHLVLKRDSATAGKGRMDLYMGDDSLSRVPWIGGGIIPTQFADTVSLAPGFGWLSGANNTGLSHGAFKWRLWA